VRTLLGVLFYGETLASICLWFLRRVFFPRWPQILSMCDDIRNSKSMRRQLPLRTLAQSWNRATVEKLNPHYVRGGTLPRKIKSGYVLCHNHVMHTLAIPSGVNGFGAWFSPDGPPTGFIRCPCGWSGLLHYAFRDHVRRQGGNARPGTKSLGRVGATHQSRRERLNVA
jgi:hypothetical protein